MKTTIAELVDNGVIYEESRDEGYFISYAITDGYMLRRDCGDYDYTDVRVIQYVINQKTDLLDEDCIVLIGESTDDVINVPHDEPFDIRIYKERF